MLRAKHGVITEPRFQALTVPQWIFHYWEVREAEEREEATQRALWERGQDALEWLAVMVNPETGKRWIEAKEKETPRAPTQKPATAEEQAQALAVAYQSLKARLPQEVYVSRVGADGKPIPRFTLSTKPRGIFVEGGIPDGSVVQPGPAAPGANGSARRPEPATPDPRAAE